MYRISSAPFPPSDRINLFLQDLLDRARLHVVSFINCREQFILELLKNEEVKECGFFFHHISHSMVSRAVLIQVWFMYYN